jgi:hypothetical protein
LTHSIVVEPVLSEEHLPKVLADLVPCLSSSCVSSTDIPLSGRNALSGTHLASLPYATKQRMWSVNSCSFITPYLYVDDFSRHCVERVKQRNESPWVTVSKCQLSAAPRGILPFLAKPASANIKTFTLDRENFQLTISIMVYCTRNIVGCR